MVNGVSEPVEKKKKCHLRLQKDAAPALGYWLSLENIKNLKDKLYIPIFCLSFLFEQSIWLYF